MAISKLNTFLTKHHRIIFGVFAILIILAFVLADWIGGGGGGSLFGSGRGNEVAATVFGEKLSHIQLNEKLRELDLMGRQISSEQAEALALQTSAMDILAKRNNIAVSEAEVNKYIVDMFRNSKGDFEENIYRKFVEKTLKDRGYNEDDFIAAVRNNLIRMKLINLFAETVIVTDSEVKSFYNMFNHRVDAISCTIKTEDYKKLVKVDAAALQKFFNENRKNYIIPAKLAAKVVKFAPEDYMSQVTVTEAELKQFYDANKARLPKVKGKDGKEVTPTFEQAKAEITMALKSQKAMMIAAEKADQFSRDAYDKVKDQPDAAKIFAAFAAEKKLKIVDTGSFSADSSKAGNIGSAEMVRSLIAVAGTDTWLSNVITEADGCYVGFLTEYIPPRQAEFKEAEAKIRNDFILSEAAKLARQRAEKLISSLKAIPDATARITRAKALSKEKFTAIPTVTMGSIYMQSVQLEEFARAYPQMMAMLMPHYMQLIEQRELFAMKPGDISVALPTADGFKIMIVTSHRAPEKPYAANAEFTAFYKRFAAENTLSALNSFVTANTQVTVQPEQEKAQ